MSERLKQLSKRIKLLRTFRNLNQLQLAKKANVSQSTIAQIEVCQKSPSIDTLFKLADALKIPIVLLFTEHLHTEDLK